MKYSSQRWGGCKGTDRCAFQETCGVWLSFTSSREDLRRLALPVQCQRANRMGLVFWYELLINFLHGSMKLRLVQVKMQLSLLSTMCKNGSVVISSCLWFPFCLHPDYNQPLLVVNWKNLRCGLGMRSCCSTSLKSELFLLHPSTSPQTTYSFPVLGRRS